MSISGDAFDDFACYRAKLDHIYANLVSASDTVNSTVNSSVSLAAQAALSSLSIVSNSEQSSVSPNPHHDSLYAWLDDYTTTNTQFLEASVDHPLFTSPEVQESLRNFLSGVCLEKSDLPVRRKGQNVIISATVLKKFVTSYDFRQILETNKPYCGPGCAFDPRLTPQQISLYRQVLERLQQQLRRLLTDYHCFQMAVETLKISKCDISCEGPQEWLIKKTSRVIEGGTSTPILVSLGWRLPRPYIGHEMVGLIHPKRNGMWKLHIIDTSNPFGSSIRKGRKRKPCSARISYTSFDKLNKNLQSLITLQFPNINRDKINKLNKETEDIGMQFRNAIYTRMKDDFPEKHSYKKARPLSYFEHQDNYGCSFNFIMPLMCIVLKEILKELRVSSPNQSLEQNLKLLTEALYLQFKIYCFAKLAPLQTDEDKALLGQQLSKERQKWMNSHQHHPFLSNIAFAEADLTNFSNINIPPPGETNYTQPAGENKQACNALTFPESMMGLNAQMVLNAQSKFASLM